MFEKYFDVAKAYILYRAEHSKIRDGYSDIAESDLVDAAYLINTKIPEELREQVKAMIGKMFQWWEASDVADLTANIIDEVCEDVINTSDYPNYNDSDLRIAIKRTIINLTSIGK